MRKVTKLDKAKAAIVLDHPFFSSILFKRPLVEDKSLPTLAVDARGTIYYNPDFIETLTVPQCVWALCHEVGHVIAKHALRRGSRNPRKWNYAGDAWINDMLNDCKVGDPIPKTVNMPGSKDKTTERIYDELPEDTDGSGRGPGGGGGGGGDDSQWDNGLGDDIKDDPTMSQSEQDKLDAEISIDITQAAQVAKMRGKMPGQLAQFVADIINPPTPWYDILERYMVNRATQEHSWRRPNRRFIGQGVYLPSYERVPSMGPIVVQVDVSGSISAQEIKYYNGHLSRIIALCNPSEVHVLYTDTDVRHHDVVPQGEEVSLSYFSGGGTHMPAGFDFVADNGIDPEVFVCLTDGYTNFGTEPDYPVVWCISTEIDAPCGETIHFSLED